MGYECPVCSTPQADARHLANHMAITAMLGRADHVDWLDEHAPGWEDAGEAELAPRVAEHAEEKSFPQVFEDTVGGLEESDPDDPLDQRGGALFDEVPHSHDHAGGHGGQHTPPEAHLAGAGVDAENLDDEAKAAIEEAREMTQAMLREESGERDSSERRAGGAERRHASEEEGDADDEEPAADADDNNA